MATINISLPLKLKSQADALVKKGYYVSFSDLVRDSLRRLIEKEKYSLWLKEAKADLKGGKAVTLKSPKDIDHYLKNL